MKRFEELRSLLNKPSLDVLERTKLWTLLKRVHVQDPEIYADQWLPYIDGFAHHFNAPLTTVESLNALESVADVAPQARFELSMYMDNLDDDDIEILVQSPHLGAVHTLTLSYNDFYVKGVRMLAQCEALSDLSGLDLTDCAMDYDCIKTITTSPCLTSLTSLRLFSTMIDDGCAQLLASWMYLNSIVELDLGNTHMTIKGLLAVLESDFCKSLICIGFSCNSLSDEDIVALVSGPFLASLVSLDLSANDIGDEGAVVLANSPNVANLTTLNLTRNEKIGEQGKQALANSPYLCEQIRHQFQ